MADTTGTARAPHLQQVGRHGEPQRGLSSTAASDLAQGKFGRMFRSLPAANFGADEQQTMMNLSEIAERMVRGTDSKPQDPPDPEESGIPALYTYFGQFVDHDITFDPASSLQKKNDPNALIDYRTPALDLDNVYGRGPDDQPYMYTYAPHGVSAMYFLEGTQLEGSDDKDARDLPRNLADPARALIGDPRNDENAIVSQLQGLFLRFHNRMAHDHRLEPFEKIQQRVRWHYQYVVVNDFMPKIVSAKVLDRLKTNNRYDIEKMKFFHWRNDPFMPVEFSVAAYRLGHSMVRPGYRLNERPDTLLPIFSDKGHEALGGFGQRKKHWAIDWAKFIDIEKRPYNGSDKDNRRRLQFAYKIDTSIVHPLKNVGSVISGGPSSLAERNLVRGWRLGLPSGQHVAHHMKETPLTDEQILIGKDVEGNRAKTIASLNKVFERNCPLWVYILAEARYNSEKVAIPVLPRKPGETIELDTPKLGPVGGRIVAEVLLGLMFGDRHSYLHQHPHWHPDFGPNFGLPQFVNYALGK